MCGTVLAGERANINCSVRKMLPTCCIWDLFSISHQIGSRTEGIGGTRPKGKKRMKRFPALGKPPEVLFMKSYIWMCCDWALTCQVNFSKYNYGKSSSYGIALFCHCHCFVFSTRHLVCLAKALNPQGHCALVIFFNYEKSCWTQFNIKKDKSPRSFFLFVIRQTFDWVLVRNCRSQKAPLSTILIVLFSEFGHVVIQAWSTARKHFH